MVVWKAQSLRRVNVEDRLGSFGSSIESEKGDAECVLWRGLITLDGQPNTDLCNQTVKRDLPEYRLSQMSNHLPPL